MKNESWFRGKTALVTGAGRGMGLAAARAFAERGALVWAATKDPAALPKGLPASVMALACDVRREQDVAAAVKTALDSSGRIDILVNAAGVSMPEPLPLEQVPSELWRHIMDTNATGTFLFCREVLPAMRRQAGGLVFNILSTGAFRAAAGNSPYSASKYAARALGEALVEETKGTPVKVTSISPGPVNTSIWSHKRRPPSEAERAKMLQPADIADLLVFLCLQEDYVFIDNITVTPRFP